MTHLHKECRPSDQQDSLVIEGCADVGAGHSSFAVTQGIN